MLKKKSLFNLYIQWHCLFLPISTTTTTICISTSTFNSDTSSEQLLQPLQPLNLAANELTSIDFIFALLSGLIGTAFSVLIRLELSARGVHYISDNQLYYWLRSHTAHAIIMIYFMVMRNNIPQPHLSFLVIQSGLFRSYIGKFNLNCMLRNTFPLFIPIVIGVGLYLGCRLPMRFMLGQLDLLTYYALFNLMVTLCSITIIANLIGKQVKPIQLYLAIFFAFFAMFLFWIGSGYSRELSASLFMLFSYLAFIWDNLKDICDSIKGNRITMGGERDNINYYKPPKDGPIGGGSSSTGAASSSNTGGGSSSTPNNNSGTVSQAAANSSYNHPHTAEEIQNILKSIPDSTNELLNNPERLVREIDNLSVFNRFSIPDEMKNEIMAEAQRRTPPVQAQDPSTPFSAFDYWNYKTANSKAKLGIKVLEVLEENRHKFDLSELHNPENYESEIKNIRDTYRGIKNVSHYKMQDLYENKLNHNAKKSIRRHMINYVNKDTPSDSE